jgi:hypothetical protein
MAFKRRYLEEGKWGDRALGATAGGLGALALMTGNDDVNDIVNNWHELDNQDQLWNHFMDKGQGFLDNLKSGDGQVGNAMQANIPGVTPGIDNQYIAPGVPPEVQQANPLQYNNGAETWQSTWQGGEQPQGYQPTAGDSVNVGHAGGQNSIPEVQQANPLQYNNGAETWQSTWQDRYAPQDNAVPPVQMPNPAPQGNAVPPVQMPNPVNAGNRADVYSMNEPIESGVGPRSLGSATGPTGTDNPVADPEVGHKLTAYAARDMSQSEGGGQLDKLKEITGDKEHPKMANGTDPFKVPHPDTVNHPEDYANRSTAADVNRQSATQANSHGGNFNNRYNPNPAHQAGLEQIKKYAAQDNGRMY